MKIVLVNPTYYSELPLGVSYGEPLGIAYIAAAIETMSKHSVEVVDSVGLATHFDKVGHLIRIGLPEEKVVEMVLEKEPDVIGITLVGSPHSKEILQFINALKKVTPKTPIIVGGPHATFEWRACMEMAPIDYTVFGEGEETIVELLDAISGEKPDFSEIKGIVYRESNTGKFIKTERRSPVPIEKIPWPARHLLPMENYFKNKPHHYYKRKPAATIFTSRACPFNCIFCSTTLFWERKYRARDPIDVVDEIESLVKHYGVREIHINDDAYLTQKKRVETICDEIIRRNLDISCQIPPGVNLSLLDENLLRKLRDSGLYAIRPQFETGNVKTIKYIRKNINLEKGREIISMANRLGMWTQTNIIIGFPDETQEDIETTINYVENLGVDSVGYLLPIPFPHTDLRKDLTERKLINIDFPIAAVADSLFLKADELEKIRNKAQSRYKWVRLKQIIRPYYFMTEFFPKINSFEKIYFFARRLWVGLLAKLFKKYI